jgi:VIT1/CCC1 family predicted Fe2+/Mn2+ transporter
VHLEEMGYHLSEAETERVFNNFKELADKKMQVDDREHYKTLKYMYIAPIYIPVYLLGRGVARFITGSIAVFITIIAGVLFLKVPLHFADINWPLFIVTLIVGVVMLAPSFLLVHADADEAE